MNRSAAVLAMVLSATLAVSACGKKEAPANAEVVENKTPVEIMEMARGKIKSEFTYSGKAFPVNEVSVMSMVAGKVASVNYDVGDKVTAGSVLFTMDTTDLQNQINVYRGSLSSADASIQSARTSLELANGASMQSQIENARTGVINAQSAVTRAEGSVQNAQVGVSNAELALNNIKTTYENNKILYESGVIAKTEFEQMELNYNKTKNAYDDAVTALNQAQAAYNTAVESLSQAEKTYDIMANQMPAENRRKAQDALNSAMASKKSIQAQIASTEKSIRDAKVTSPISGVVSACNVKAGTVLAQSPAPFTIIDTSYMNIEVDAAESIINTLKPGQEAEVKIATLSEKSFTATIETVSPSATSTGTYRVKVKIPNGDGQIKAGMFGEVSFVNQEKNNALIIPRDALIERSDESYVYIEENGTAKKVVVETGIDTGEAIEVTSGLQDGMHVIVKGQTYLEDGDAVSVIATQSLTEQTQASEQTGSNGEKPAAENTKKEGTADNAGTAGNDTAKNNQTPGNQVSAAENAADTPSKTVNGGDTQADSPEDSAKGE